MNGDGVPRGNAAIRALAKERGVTIPEMLALSRAHDPFFSGSGADVEKAEWFKAAWDRSGYSAGVHLRRVHYRINVRLDLRELGRVERSRDKRGRKP